MGETDWHDMDSMTIGIADATMENDFRLAIQHESLHTMHLTGTCYGFARQQLSAIMVTYISEEFRQNARLRSEVERLVDSEGWLGYARLEALSVLGSDFTRTAFRIGRGLYSLRRLLDGELDREPESVRKAWYEHARRAWHWLLSEYHWTTSGLTLGDAPDQLREQTMALFHSPWSRGSGLTVRDILESAALAMEERILLAIQTREDGFERFADQEHRLGEIVAGMRGDQRYSAAYVYWRRFNPSDSNDVFLLVVEAALNGPLFASLMSPEDHLHSLDEVLPVRRFERACELSASMPTLPAPQSAGLHVAVKGWLDELATRCGWTPLSVYAERAFLLRQLYRHEDHYRNILTWATDNRPLEMLGTTSGEVIGRLLVKNIFDRPMPSYSYRVFVSSLELLATRAEYPALFAFGFSSSTEEALDLAARRLPPSYDRSLPLPNLCSPGLILVGDGHLIVASQLAISDFMYQRGARTLSHLLFSRNCSLPPLEALQRPLGEDCAPKSILARLINGQIGLDVYPMDAVDGV